MSAGSSGDDGDHRAVGTVEEGELADLRARSEAPNRDLEAVEDEAAIEAVGYEPELPFDG
jgi:hypothetical protein